MKIFQGFTRLAHVPPHANVVDHDGIHGYWQDTNTGNKVFLNAKNNRVHLPKALRGRNLEDLSFDDLKNVPPDDFGETHYANWRDTMDKERSANSLHNGYEFTEQGHTLVERLMKFVQKYHLDDVKSLGIDSSLNVSPRIFEKMLGARSRDDVKKAARLLGKRVRAILLELAKTGNKKTERIEGDFFLTWTKLEPLFGFDPHSYNPESKDADDEAPADDSMRGLPAIADKLRSEVQPLIHPQMTHFTDVFNNFLAAVMERDMNKATESFENMQKALLTYIEAAPGHEVGQASEIIFTLPIMVDVFEALGISV